ncbi:hypothetical protein ZTR_02867 [Talaromyces verruculosus]|nr:hypothetical protein ZTR_02867 [Talaromyces verruculosus]
MKNNSPSGSPIPIHRINLSLPPSERYVPLATLYASRMRAVLPIFDELITSLSPHIPLALVHHLARLFLRGLWSREETDEIHGIARATGVEVYFLVGLNTVLDLLMGCSSGGILTKPAPNGREGGMVHLRTLDWAMDPLRELVVQLDFVREPIGSLEDGRRGGEVLASSITYVGFVGVLTGVRKGLSASLNFRPVHNDRSGLGGNLAFYTNHLLVLLGRRQSISSLMRECIFASFQESSSRRKKEISDLKNISWNIPGLPTTAAYLIFSDGTTTLAMEKDYKTAVMRSSSSFIVTTNHDQPPPPSVSESDTDRAGKEKKKMGNHLGLTLASSDVQTIQDLIEESTERYECLQARWDKKIRRHNRQKLRNSEQAERGTRSSLRLRQKREEDAELAVTRQEAIEWLTMYPVLNESTHYACLMDPKKGEIFWGRRYDASEWE